MLEQTTLYSACKNLYPSMLQLCFEESQTLSSILWFVIDTVIYTCILYRGYLVQSSLIQSSLYSVTHGAGTDLHLYDRACVIQSDKTHDIHKLMYMNSNHDRSLIIFWFVVCNLWQLQTDFGVLRTQPCNVITIIIYSTQHSKT